jgi:hypothetical protein
MVRSRKLVQVAVAVTVSLAGLVASAGQAAAKGGVVTGSITCQLSQTISFNPPLVSSVAGTKGYAFDRITVSPAQISNCTGTTTPAGAVPTIGMGTKATVLKWRGSKINGAKYAGGCPQLPTFLWSKLRPSYNWTATGMSLKTKVFDIFEQGTTNGLHESGFIFSGTASGSFAGPVTIADFFDSASSAALQSCEDGGGPVSSLTTDSTTSFISVG